MTRLIEFPQARRLGFQRIKSSYSTREISRLFGISEKYLKIWTDAQIIAARPSGKPGELEFDIQALQRFRDIRDKRAAGTTLKQIDEELRGQLGLFQGTGQVLALPVEKSSFMKGLLLFDRQDPASKSEFQRAVQEQDHPADAWCNLGIIAHEEGKCSEAVDCFTNGLSLNARHFECHFNLGNLYAEAGSLKPAALHYSTAIQIEPEFPDTYFNLALVRAQEQEWKDTRDLLRRYAAFDDADKREIAEDIARQIDEVLRQ